MSWQSISRRRGQVAGLLSRGHTLGMKAAVSIPDDVFEEADRLARELKTSRSQLYSRALKEFLARHAPDQVTEAMDRVCDELEKTSNDFARQAARRVLENTEW
jgi:metal-responsive CopG/Arc/MetJ family transcriptional regulator